VGGGIGVGEGSGGAEKGVRGGSKVDARREETTLWGIKMRYV
jgi:hypothetical protein